jgi:YD repeat-containing protein
METSTGITASSQDIPHAGTAGRAAKWTAILPGRCHADGSIGTRNGWAKRIAAITVLGLAGALSVTACSTGPSPSPAPTHVVAPATQQSHPASTPTAQPAVRIAPSSQPDSGAGGTAQNIADYLVSSQYEAGDGTTATDASCDPATVSDPPAVTTPTTASCDITYSDGSVWQQTVTITYDNQGNPVSVSTNDGIELAPAANE